MPEANWQISGDYFETCNCDFLCPCITSNLTEKPTQGGCISALAMRVDEGQYGAIRLDGLNFAVIVSTPGPMIEGNWTVGLIIDERASEEQKQALAAIASGEAGGPMAGLAPLLGTFAGVESAPMRFEKNGLGYSISIPGRLDQAVEGVPSAADPAQPVSIDNTMHPVSARLGLAKATRSHVHAFGLGWDNPDGGNNGFVAPFTWTGA